LANHRERGRAAKALLIQSVAATFAGATQANGISLPNRGVCGAWALSAATIAERLGKPAIAHIAGKPCTIEGRTPKSRTHGVIIDATADSRRTEHRDEP